MEQIIHLLAEALVSLKHLQVVDHLNLDRLGGPARGVGCRDGVLPLGLFIDVQDVEVVTHLISLDRHSLSAANIATILLPADFRFGLSRNLELQFNSTKIELKLKKTVAEDRFKKR